MKRFTRQPGDTLRIVAEDVKWSLTDEPVTAGLTGSVNVYDSDNTLLSTSVITLNRDNDWYVDVAAPATVGLYRLAMVLTVGSAQRTDEAELRVV